MARTRTNNKCTFVVLVLEADRVRKYWRRSTRKSLLNCPHLCVHLDQRMTPWTAELVQGSYSLVLSTCRTILTEGNNVAGHHRLFSQIQEELRTVMSGPVIVLTAADVSTVQNLQKKIVAGSLNIDAVDDDDEGATSKVVPLSS